MLIIKETVHSSFVQLSCKIEQLYLSACSTRCVSFYICFSSIFCVQPYSSKLRCGQKLVCNPLYVSYTKYWHHGIPVVLQNRIGGTNEWRSWFYFIEVMLLCLFLYFTRCCVEPYSLKIQWRENLVCILPYVGYHPGLRRTFVFCAKAS